MNVFKVPELEKAIQLSIESAIKEFDSLTKENVEDVLAKGFEIVKTYQFHLDTTVSFNPETGEKYEKEIIVPFVKFVAKNDYRLAWNTYKRMVDFSKLPIKNPFFHQANKNKFVKTCKELFPNVDAFNVGACLTNFRRIIENIYYNLGFEGLKPQQVSFYQYSALGGTGKSEFTKRLETFLKSKNIPNTHAQPNTRWIGSEYSSNLVGFVDEFFPPRGTDSDRAIISLNNIIDNTEYQVEYKCQDSYFNHSRVTLLVNSNKMPFDTNTRRYGIVRYNEQPYSQISKENKEKYFPQRTEEEWNQLFTDAFESCPFGETFEDLECKNSDTLNDLIFSARYYIDHAPETMKIGIQEMTIRQFVSNYYELKNDYGKTDTKFTKQEIWRFTESLRKAVALGVIQPSVRINGNMAYSKYNWQEIANIPTNEDDINNSLNDIDNIFERTRVAFDNFLDITSSGPSGPSGGDDDNTRRNENNNECKSTENNKEGLQEGLQVPENDKQSERVQKLSDGWLYCDYFFTKNEQGEEVKCFKKCELENKGQKQVCINKPKEPTNISRKNEDVEQHNFLFEIDPAPYTDSVESYFMTEEEYYKEKRKENLNKMYEFYKTFPENVIWFCYSGNKSTHIVLKTNCNDSKYREYIFNYFNKKYFDNQCDKACKNAGRLARNPNAVRENGVVQRALVINEDAKPLDVSQLMHEYDNKEYEENQRLAELREHQKQYTGQDKRTPMEKLRAIVNKTAKESGKLALDILETGVATSGSNMIGAIGYLRTLGEYCDPCFTELAEECRQICHFQHPSNI